MKIYYKKDSSLYKWLYILIFLFLFFCCDNKETLEKQTNLNLDFLESISNNNLEKAIKYLDSGAEINAEDDFKRTALIYAAINNNENIAEYLINFSDINLDSRDYSGKTAFEYASINNNINMIKLLINAGTDLNTESDSGNALVRAVENNNPETVKILINAGADLDARNAYGLTPVMIAVDKRNIELLVILLRNGADVNAEVSNARAYLDEWPEGTKAIYSARLQGDSEITDILISAGAEKNSKPDTELSEQLFQNAQSFNNDKAKILIDEGADVNAYNEIGMTPLMIAAEKDNYELAKLLIMRGADVNAKVPIKHKYWSKGTTALIIAANNGSTSIINLLLKAGADINIKERYGNTALEEAKNNGHTEIYHLLLNWKNEKEQNLS